ncbi:MAG: thiol reductant ABC exporter subunit CydC [Gammaproteobacteria bacterium RIFCSPHIGHO2_12_FULL_42_13]|nr:MAG: thiol reductant ABC exporter subunit CydC [Gammaproteobacteria bacterium RIFCSPHIGHO2_12_FULL_42_13]
MILFLLKQVLHARWKLLLGFSLSLLLALSSIALLAISGWFITASALAGLTAITAMQFNYFIPAGVIRLLAFIRILSRYFDRVVNHDVTLTLLSQWRVWFYEKLLPLSPAKLIHAERGKLLNHMTQDINTLDRYYLSFFLPLSVTFIVLMAVIATTFYFSPMISMLSFVTILFFILMTVLFVLPRALSAGSKIQESMMRLRVECVEFFQGYFDKQQYGDTSQSLTDRFLLLSYFQKKMAKLKGLSIASTSFFSGLTIFLILWIAIPLVNQHILSAAILTLLILLVLGTFEQLSVIPAACLSLGETAQAVTELKKVVNDSPEVVFSAQHAQKMLSLDLQIQQISFHYPNRSQNVIHDFSLMIPHREKIGICGPSGAGKSTLAYLLTRVWDPQSGDIFIGDKNLKTLSESQLRQTILLVAQNPHIFNTTVRENLIFSRKDIDDQACWEALKKVVLADVIRSLPVQLDTPMGEFGKYFSGGQIRRIAIARALLFPTPILILDEPSAGLDENTMTTLWENCAEDFSRKTIIVLSHDEKLLRKMGRVATLEN